MEKKTITWMLILGVLAITIFSIAIANLIPEDLILKYKNVAGNYFGIISANNSDMITQLSDGTKIEKNQDNTSIIIRDKDDNQIFNITSSTKYNFITDKEWAYEKAGYEIVESKEKLIIKGDFICIEDNYIVESEGTLMEMKTFTNCIYYEPQHDYQMDFVYDPDTNKSELENVSIPKRFIRQIDDYKVNISFDKDYDPLISNFTEGLISCWSLDNLSDEFGDNNLSLPATNPPTANDSEFKLGTGSYFWDGADNGLFAADDPSLRIGVSEFTILAWLKFDVTAPDTNPTYIGKGDTGSGEWMSRVASKEAGTVGFFADGGGINVNSGILGNISNNVWTMVVIERNSTHTRFNINGSWSPSSDTSDSANLSTTKILELGTGDQSTSRQWKGHIDEVAMWNIGLNSSQIIELYNDTVGLTCAQIIATGTVEEAAEDQFDTLTTLTINSSTDDFRENITFVANITCILNITEEINLTQNGTLINTGTTPLINISTFSSLNDTFYNCSYPGNSTHNPSSDSSTIFAVNETVVADNPPFYTVGSNETNSTDAGSDILHSLEWNDDISLSGYIFSFCNGSIDENNCTSGYILNPNDTFDISGDGLLVPVGIAFDPSNNTLWIADFDDSFVYHYDRNGNLISGGFSTAGAGATAIWGVTTNGTHFWVTDTSDNFVYLFNSSKENITGGFDVSGEFQVTRAIDHDRTTNRSLWMSNDGKDRVYNYTFAGVNSSSFETTNAGGIDDLDGITIDTRDGTIWIVDSNNTDIFHFTKNGTNITDGFDISLAGANPRGLAFDSTDNSFWVVGLTNTNVYHFIHQEGWVNDSFVEFGGTINWSNVTKKTTAVNNSRISWQITVNDSANNINSSEIFFYTVLTPTISDTCTSGLTDCIFDCLDNCIGIDVDCDGQNFLLTGNGTFKGNVTNYSNKTIQSDGLCNAWTLE